MNKSITVSDRASQVEISVLDVSAQVQSRLRRSGIRFVSQLEALNAGELLCLKELGGGSVRAVRQALAKLGTSLDGDEALLHRSSRDRKNVA